MEFTKEYVRRTLSEAHLWKHGEADTFRYKNCKYELHKDTETTPGYPFYLRCETDGSTEIGLKPFRNMEEAFLYIIFKHDDIKINVIEDWLLMEV